MRLDLRKMRPDIRKRTVNAWFFVLGYGTVGYLAYFLTSALLELEGHEWTIHNGAANRFAMQSALFSAMAAAYVAKWWERKHIASKLAAAALDGIVTFQDSTGKNFFQDYAPELDGMLEYSEVNAFRHKNDPELPRARFRRRELRVIVILIVGWVCLGLWMWLGRMK